MKQLVLLTVILSICNLTYSQSPCPNPVYDDIYNLVHKKKYTLLTGYFDELGGKTIKDTSKYWPYDPYPELVNYVEKEKTIEYCPSSSGEWNVVIKHKWAEHLSFEINIKTNNKNLYSTLMKSIQSYNNKETYNSGRFDSMDLDEWVDFYVTNTNVDPNNHDLMTFGLEVNFRDHKVESKAFDRYYEYNYEIIFTYRSK